MQESLSFSPNTHNASSVGKRMLNLSWTLLCIPHWMIPNIYGVHADTCSPFLIVSSRSYLDQGGPMIYGMPSSR